MKKILSMVLIAAMALIGTAALAEGIPADEITVGYIYIGDENEAYTAAHYEGAKAMAEALGLSEDQIIIKWNTAETEACYDAAIDLAEAGCDIIFGNSFNFESYDRGGARVPRSSSATRPAIRRRPAGWTTCTTTSLPSMSPATSPASLRA